MIDKRQKALRIYYTKYKVLCKEGRPYLSKLFCCSVVVSEETEAAVRSKLAG